MICVSPFSPSSCLGCLVYLVQFKVTMAIIIKNLITIMTVIMVDLVELKVGLIVGLSLLRGDGCHCHLRPGRVDDDGDDGDGGDDDGDGDEKD